MGKSTINGHFQLLFVCSPEGIWNMSLQTNAKNLSEKGAIYSLKHKTISCTFHDGGSFVYIVVLVNHGYLYQKGLLFLEECAKHLLCSSNNITFLSEIHDYLKTMALYSKM